MEGMITKKIFGESGEIYYPTIKTLVTSINNTTYPFVSERSFIDTIKTDISKELEDILIGFLSKNEDIPESIRSKSTIHYLNKLENGKSGALIDFYSKLCGITQPAASSIAFFFLPNYEKNCILMNGLDEEYIAAFVEGFKSTISDIFQLSLQASFTTLKTLNLFPHEKLHTPIIDQIDLPEIDLWNNIMKYFN